MDTGTQAWRWILLIIGLALAVGIYTMGTERIAATGIIVVSLTFLIGVPFGLAFGAVLAVRPSRRVVGVLVGLLPTTLAVSVLALAGWEGTICLVMASPLLLLGALGGGLAAFDRISRATPVELIAVLVAPLLLMPLEKRLPPTDRLHETVAEIVIAATPARVWDEIAEVDTILARERQRAFYTTIGFPAPIAATLDVPQEGGVRIASFERGFSFIETITEWEPGVRLSFAIEPRDAGPEPALDSHVRVGGQYFDVLQGTYEIGPAGEGRVRLRLRSEHRVTTRFNLYSGWWADRVMLSVQRNILEVIRARSEDAARGPKARIRAATEARASRKVRLPLDATTRGTGWSIEGRNRGVVDIYADSVVVLLSEPALFDGPGNAPERVDSITASIARASGNSWSPRSSSAALVLEAPIAAGDSLALGPLRRFTIPRSRGESLAEGWVLITYHLTVPRTPENPSGLAWTYAHDKRRSLNAP